MSSHSWDPQGSTGTGGDLPLLALRHFALGVAKGLEGIQLPVLPLVLPHWLSVLAWIQGLVMGLMTHNPKIQRPFQLMTGVADHKPVPHTMLQVPPRKLLVKYSIV